MKIAIVGNGDPFNFSEQIALYDYIIAADGGANICRKYSITPDSIIGDNDSISDRTQAAFSKTAYAHVPDQDTTDLMKAIEHAYTLISDQAVSLDLFCVTSNDRIDHTVAALHCLATIPVINTIHTKHQTIQFVDTSMKIQNSVDNNLSIVPYNSAAVVTLQGFRWNGDNIEISNQRSGISNIITHPLATITVQSGSIFAILNNNETHLP